MKYLPLLAATMLFGCAITTTASAVEYAAIAVDAPAGDIIISQHRRRLYLALGNGRALAYPVAVAKPGKEWLGEARIDGKYVNPAWSPPVSVKRDHPELPDVIAGGSRHNPMGVRALTLDRDEIAIHGTNRPELIGRSVSYGCIRMNNADVADLYERVRVGTRVVMVP